MKLLRVTYNGYEVEHFNTDKEVRNYISSKINKDIEAEKVHRHGKNNVSIIVYQYRTLQSEMFMIEEL